MTKTVQAQYMNFNRFARLWNKLSQRTRMSDSLKGLAQAKVIKKSVILFRVLNMTI